MGYVPLYSDVSTHSLGSSFLEINWVSPYSQRVFPGFKMKLILFVEIQGGGERHALRPLRRGGAEEERLYAHPGTGDAGQ